MESAKLENKQQWHDHFAPYWAVTLFVLVGLGLATIAFDFKGFWKGYMLDMVGPAWNYILIRGLFTRYHHNAWATFFTPIKTFLILLFVSYSIEIAQYFRIYEATFDPMDFVAYVSLLLPAFILDLKQQARMEKN